jgi:hypothetical protein
VELAVVARVGLLLWRRSHLGLGPLTAEVAGIDEVTLQGGRQRVDVGDHVLAFEAGHGRGNVLHTSVELAFEARRLRLPLTEFAQRLRDARGFGSPADDADVSVVPEPVSGRSGLDGAPRGGRGAPPVVMRRECLGGGSRTQVLMPARP